MKNFPIYFLIWGSGFSALVYQTVWFREFRQIFGCSTYATAAVMAIFMGGLGIGSRWLGGRADKTQYPLRFYAKLEVGVALLAAVSPWLIDLTRLGYIEVCATSTPGFFAKTLFRLLLAALIMGPPTILMGGTLPAVAKAATLRKDAGRIAVAVLYGCNTLGAVFGVFSGTFFLFELLGFRKTLWLAAFLNLVVAGMAFRLSSEYPTVECESEDSKAPAVAPPMFVYGSSFICGFCFFLLEIVWFRLLGPLMGGTTYSFGQILGIALFGIGIGGLFFQFRSDSSQATPLGFACSCALQGTFVAFSFALGDLMAILTLLMKYFPIMGFSGMIFSWTIIGLITVFPVAVVAGYQFPLLISLLGRGEKNLGREVGQAYAWNTAGSILGSLLGGFFLLPALSAPGCWRLAGFCLSVTGCSWAVWFWKKEPKRPGYLFPLVLGGAGIFLLSWPGPTAFSRHGSVGYGSQALPKSWNELLKTVNWNKRMVALEFEGVENIIGIRTADGIEFLVNGKSDGNSLRDGEMQIMAGLVSAIFHPNPEKVFVVGLGTGCTSGALGKVESIKKVVTAEIEPKILEVVERCRDVNFAALENPKLVNVIDDAREVLLTSPETFDLIVSEPSNPHRAGISSLFTKEFYEVVKNKLTPEGIFTQWVQAYHIDSETYSSIFATLFTVFPYIETWETRFSGDTFLVCSTRPILWDIERLRNRITREPFRSALASTWKSYDLESFLAKFVCTTEGGKLIARKAQQTGRINSDDWLPIEYGFAKSVRSVSESLVDLRTTAQMFGFDRPPIAAGIYNEKKLAESRIQLYTYYGFPAPVFSDTDPDLVHSINAQEAWGRRFFSEARDHWSKRSEIPQNLVELIMYCESFAESGEDRILPLLEKFPEDREIEKLVIKAKLSFHHGDFSDCASLLNQAFSLHRSNPWPLRPLILRALDLSIKLAGMDKKFAQPLYESLEKPFCQMAVNEDRKLALLQIARVLPNEFLFKQFQEMDPAPIWEEDMLVIRQECYRQVSPEHGNKAFEDLMSYYDTFSPTLSRLCKTIQADR